jgi:transposase
MQEKPDLTVDGLLQELEQQRGANVCRDTVWRFIRHAGLSFKKNRSRRRARPT